jgi:hypothetical protein
VLVNATMESIHKQRNLPKCEPCPSESSAKSSNNDILAALEVASKRLHSRRVAVERAVHHDKSGPVSAFPAKNVSELNEEVKVVKKKKKTGSNSSNDGSSTRSGKKENKSRSQKSLRGIEMDSCHSHESSSQEQCVKIIFDVEDILYGTTDDDDDELDKESLSTIYNAEPSKARRLSSFFSRAPVDRKSMSKRRKSSILRRLSNVVFGKRYSEDTLMFWDEIGDINSVSEQQQQQPMRLAARTA